MRNLPARHGVRGFGAVGLCGFWRSSFATLTHRSVCREFAEVPWQLWRREKCTRPPSAATAAHERPSAAAHSTHPATIRTNSPPCYTLHADHGGWQVLAGRKKILGVVEFLAELILFVDLFRPKVRPWLGRSSVQREAGRASCAGAAAPRRVFARRLSAAATARDERTQARQLLTNGGLLHVANLGSGGKFARP